MHYRGIKETKATKRECLRQNIVKRNFPRESEQVLRMSVPRSSQ